MFQVLIKGGTRYLHSILYVYLLNIALLQIYGCKTVTCEKVKERDTYVSIHIWISAALHTHASCRQHEAKMSFRPEAGHEIRRLSLVFFAHPEKVSAF